MPRRENHKEVRTRSSPLVRRRPRNSSNERRLKRYFEAACTCGSPSRLAAHLDSDILARWTRGSSPVGDFGFPSAGASERCRAATSAEGRTVALRQFTTWPRWKMLTERCLWREQGADPGLRPDGTRSSAATVDHSHGESNPRWIRRPLGCHRSAGRGGSSSAARAFASIARADSTRRGNGERTRNLKRRTRITFRHNQGSGDAARECPR
jgi:hypothetical protein